MPSLFPGLKWFVVRGSPCQDLTFAGCLQGLLGLVGARSRLFFLLLLTIRTMQVLVGCKSVRFLVENAGSMLKVHFVTFCKLHNLPYEPFERYCWDVAMYTPFITRKRNFFRNTADFEAIPMLQSWTQESCGPLLALEGGVTPFAPLLRTRKELKYGMCHSSWTLYPPPALVWDYSHWGGKEPFATSANSIVPKSHDFDVRNTLEKILGPPPAK